MPVEQTCYFFVSSLDTQSVSQQLSVGCRRARLDVQPDCLHSVQKASEIRRRNLDDVVPIRVVRRYLLHHRFGRECRFGWTICQCGSRMAQRLGLLGVRRASVIITPGVCSRHLHFVVAAVCPFARRLLRDVFGRVNRPACVHPSERRLLI